ncbi:TPA: hypothetical protein VDZ06_000127 [Streptococcus pyogenes]|uniref:hypothetical protein n=1 Tax=Streptococcus pyogenes TaxID=1314 RepID=UPI000DA2A914|nr:hypothetical protein [Streptococcus pyogenes]SQF10072.1 Uncharacterised protein [Streptococcus pyogenes]VGT99773.1 Uncharacterised protein [Streptococcus pyogenes]HEQ0431872.1 hypothetical protein [Streptococcus pyogenes]HEQ0440240.1 hypothetical protein [Streptococcus pyogenes]HEQ0466257.1 hypothetical protein [Streptococcus pyogenes]
MARKIIIFEKVKVDNVYLIDFRNEKSLYKHFPDIYVFLKNKANYQKIKKMMQSANRIKYKKNN